MSDTPVRDMLRAKGDPFAAELDMLEQLLTAEMEMRKNAQENDDVGRERRACAGAAGA